MVRGLGCLQCLGLRTFQGSGVSGFRVWWLRALYLGFKVWCLKFGLGGLAA